VATVFSQTGECIIVTDARGLMLEVNLKAAKLLGVARQAMLKRPMSRYLFKADQDIY
jgi:PAS domain S-box-containing protein